MQRFAILTAGLVMISSAFAEHQPGTIHTAKIGTPRSIDATAGDLIRLRAESNSSLEGVKNLKVTVEGDAVQTVAVVTQPRMMKASIGVSNKGKGKGIEIELNPGLNAKDDAKDDDDKGKDDDDDDDGEDKDEPGDVDDDDDKDDVKPGAKAGKRRPLIGSQFLDAYLVAKSEGTAKITVVSLDQAGKAIGKPYTVNVKVAAHTETAEN